MKKVILIWVSALLLSGSLNAQITNVTDDTSTPIPGVGHDYIKMLSETVNPANGSVSIRIALPTPPGRELTIPFTIAYDSNGVHHAGASVGGVVHWATNSGFLSQGGWTYSVPQAGFVFGTYQNAGGYTCPYYTAYTFGDPLGTRHALTGLYDTPSSTHCPNASTVSGGDDFYKANLSSGLNIVDADGTNYAFSATGGCGWPETSAYTELPYEVEDRNGNELQFTGGGGTVCSGAFTVTDTLGRGVISSSGFGATGNTVTISGLGPYSLTWGITPASYTVGYSPFGSTSHCGGFAAVSETDNVVSVITLPNGQTYQFFYDSTYGLLNKVIYPTGGYVSYSWSVNPLAAAASYADDLGTPNTCGGTYDVPAISHRYVSFDGVNIAQQQDFGYSPATQWSTSSPGEWTSKSTIVTTHDLVRGTAFTTTYAYSPIQVASPPRIPDLFATQISVEQSVIHNDIGSGPTLETIAKIWYDQFLLQSQSTTLGSVTSKLAYSYGTGGVVTEKDEYDYGASTPTRKLVTTYQAFGNTGAYRFGPSIYDRPCKAVTYDGAGNRANEIDYFYDNGGTGTPCGSAGTPSVTGVSNLTNHDETNYGPGSTSPRGNVTTKSQWLNIGSPSLTTYTYDESGEVLSKTDPCGNSTCGDMVGTSHTTTFSYRDSFTVLSAGANEPCTSGCPNSGVTNAYLTKATDPLGHFAIFSYDYNSGQLTIASDLNSQVTNYTYNDSFSRPTLTQFPDGGSVSISYNDAVPSFTTTKAVVSGLSMETTTTADKLGHTIQTELSSDPQGPDFVDTQYDGIGRVLEVSNPYRSTSDLTYSLTTYTYDALSRVCIVGRPDGSPISPSATCPTTAPSGDILTQYSSNCTTVTDEAGKTGKSCTDALGRLSTFWEDSGAAPHANYVTYYFYDALNDLFCVQQNGNASGGTACPTTPSSTNPFSSLANNNYHGRWFVYDSFARITDAYNPESGPTNWTYDANGNVSARVDARGLTTNYTFDVLNRVTQKAYPNGNTATVTFYYDGSKPPSSLVPTNGIGRRTGMSDTSEGWTVWSYDSMGRMNYDQRDINGSVRSLKYQFNFLGDVTQITYPYVNGTVLRYAYDGAGRVANITDTTNGINYAGSFMTGPQCQQITTTYSPICYAPNGSPAAYYLGYVSGNPGMGVSVTHQFNSRLQPQAFSATSSTSQLASVTYGYNLGADNGNLGSATDYLTLSNSVNYSYDSLNRIKQYQSQSGNQWNVLYSIDPWGNLTQKSPMSGYGGEVFNGGATNNANQFITGFTYDGGTATVGDVTNDGQYGYTYDAENRIASVNGIANYFYDGDGQRVAKSTGENYWGGTAGTALFEGNFGASATEYIYLNSIRIAQRTLSGTPAVSFYLVDTLGSTTAMTDATGALLVQYNYAPYGELHFHVCNDSGTHYKFTGKERDVETCNDFFGARNYSSASARFLSPDPMHFQASMMTDPQQFNLYAYVRNNPLTLIDPSGEAIQLLGDDDARKEELDALKNGVGAKAGAYLYDNAVTDANGNVSHYVGILSGGPDGKGPSFDSINGASSALSGIVNDKEVASLSVVPSGTKLNGDTQGKVVIGPSPGHAPGLTDTFAGKWVSYLMDTSNKSAGYLPGNRMSNGQRGNISPGILAFHELGHQWYGIKHPVLNWLDDQINFGGSYKYSLELENMVRQVQDPGGATRTEH